MISEDHSATVGVITGLRAEALCLRGLGVQVACSGGSSERARAEAARLIAGGAVGLVSFGLAGGLAPELHPGDLLLPEVVRLPDGGSIPTDPPWRERLRSSLGTAGLSVAGGALAGSDRVVTTARDTQRLLEATGALAVDMESHAVAASAREAGIPLLVVRAIADPYDQVIPLVAREALRPDGRVRVRASVGGLVRQPGELMTVLRLGWLSARGLITLRRAAARAGPRLDFDSSRAT